MEQEKLTFEDYGYDNGQRYWWALDFCKMLGYSGISSFMNSINKAIQSCMSSNIEYYDDFVRTKRIIDGKEINDFKLSRFACYMVAMNGDPKKEQVARAQIYFASQVEKINLILEGSNDVDRIKIREELKVNNIALSSEASKHGVVNFGMFHDAGYKGLYNQGIKQVKAKKGIKPSFDHFDFMGRTELATNLFRVTLTEERLKKSASTSEQVAQQIHRTVGKQVRKIVKDNTGKFPEELPKERRLGDVKKELLSSE